MLDEKNPETPEELELVCDWWSHSVCPMPTVEDQPGEFTVSICNDWTLPQS